MAKNVRSIARRFCKECGSYEQNSALHGENFVVRIIIEFYDRQIYIYIYRSVFSAVIDSFHFMCIIYALGSEMRYWESRHVSREIYYIC